MALRRTVAFIQKWQPLYLRDGQRDHARSHDDSPRLVRWPRTFTGSADMPR